MQLLYSSRNIKFSSMRIRKFDFRRVRFPFRTVYMRFFPFLGLKIRVRTKENRRFQRWGSRFKKKVDDVVRARNCVRKDESNFQKMRRKCDSTCNRIEVRFSFSFFILFESASNITLIRVIRSLTAVLDRYLPWKSAHCFNIALSRDRSRPAACIHARRPANDS